ncbi:cysteine desulfurase NifS [Nodularia spumigena CS-584]|jgi:cysteine desulfurase|uniref:Cysteine desulfurase n=2 Tax=Nodularia spumigena TaxID=70799 RepID=A0A2S0QAQ9_NODSP|nr:cysteine desulfurase NifS [Nodularia spumigena]AHJ30368.1 Cysteine desulfurase, NifS subfamily [Nodularia spumigena CCY9414]AVZ31410.1 cysteine desulfurase [Nodularia spumigena UHCC 0039]EAW47017.1 Aromatic amino acid beta-eliminating lyase/threonine aldolase [Nodularia spumigena CCY9414]MDB9383468.1 cysteine desulfurase NifS [Nodularia spumigena CS-584]MEA5526101.1 cysteine desulfurase NifS [Nodularia spumigena UHCC 0143]
MSIIYLDNNATTKVDPEVLEAMLPYLRDYYGNPSSMHTFGGQLGKAVKTARQQLAALIGAEESEIVYTSCGTEGDNAAIRAALLAQPERRHIITTQVEHPAVLNVCKQLETQGYTVTYLSVNRQGQLDLNELEASLTGNTALVTIMYANNETGTVFPIEQIGLRVKEYGAIFHVDAVQAVGKIPLNMKTSTIDMLTLSGHKIHAPKGIGALYVRRGVRFRPLLIGGHQERGRRAGTENVPGIIALGKAAELELLHLEEATTRERKLRDRLEQTLLAKIPDCEVNGDPTQRLPNTTNIGFKYIEGEAILLSLNKYGICASSGSACTSGSLEPSHVLRAMGLPYTTLHGSIRFSLCRYSTEAEIDQVIEVMPSIIERLRAMSPFKNDDAGWLQEQEQALIHR